LPGKLAASKVGSPWNVVVFARLKGLAAGSGKALSSFVASGGGLVLFLGDAMSAKSIQRRVARSVAGSNRNPETTAELGSAWRIAVYDTNSMASRHSPAPIAAIFASRNSPNAMRWKPSKDHRGWHFSTMAFR